MFDSDDRAANAIDRANQKAYEKLAFYREVMKRFEKPENAVNVFLVKTRRKFLTIINPILILFKK